MASIIYFNRRTFSLIFNSLLVNSWLTFRQPTLNAILATSGNDKTVAVNIEYYRKLGFIPQSID